MQRVVAAAVVALLLTGCSDGAPAPDVTSVASQDVVPYLPPPEPVPPGPPPPREESGTAEVYGIAAVSCANGTEAVADLHWEYLPLERAANDTSLAIHLEWQPVNPTANELRILVRDRDEPAGPVHHQQEGPSPQDLVLFQRDLQALNETTYLQIGIDGCASEAPIGVHVVDSGQPQRVDWTLAWNMASDQ